MVLTTAGPGCWSSPTVAGASVTPKTTAPVVQHQTGLASGNSFVYIYLNRRSDAGS